jgi:uncharacterized secreted protein with C-terminal beta-propeller domain
MTPESIQPQYTPEEIIAKLQAHPKFGSQIKPITKHQSAIISSGLEPAVVIAGAGSGKTETMSNRVLYLVANGFATPDQILGLTFTRKAAGELSVRIRKRLRQLSQLPEFKHITSISTAVTTYHSYAGKLLSEHANPYTESMQMLNRWEKRLFGRSHLMLCATGLMILIAMTARLAPSLRICSVFQS